MSDAFVTHDPARTPDLELLGEAADWVLRLREEGSSRKSQQEFERWRAQSAAHDDAWRRAEGVLQMMTHVPAGIGRDVMRSVGSKSRRRALRTLGLLIAATPAAWLALQQRSWESWSADIATATGERKAIDLADGSHLVVNTASSVDIMFTPHERRLHLNDGEILVRTQRDPLPTPRPFLVETAHGTLRALGTRFAVRRLGDETRVTVFEHAVEVTNARGDTRIFNAGEQSTFDARAIQSPQQADIKSAAWEHGMLAATSLRLADVIAELARYRRGVLRCDPAVADLRFSGALSLDDTDAALRLLTRHLPVRLQRMTSLWVSIGPA